MKIIKLYLHISKDEQKKRLGWNGSRIPTSGGRFPRPDFNESKLWNDYTAALRGGLLASVQHAGGVLGTSYRRIKNGFGNPGRLPHHRGNARGFHTHEIPFPHNRPKKNEIPLSPGIVKGDATGESLTR